MPSISESTTTPAKAMESLCQWSTGAADPGLDRFTYTTVDNTKEKEKEKKWFLEKNFRSFLSSSLGGAEAPVGSC